MGIAGIVMALVEPVAHLDGYGLYNYGVYSYGMYNHVCLWLL